MRPPTLQSRGPALWALAVLVAFDAAFVLLHVLHNSGDSVRGHLEHDRYSLETDRGVAELYGYGKEAFLVVALAVLYRRRRTALYAAWSFAFLVVLLDDVLLVHERRGQDLASVLDLPAMLGLRPQDLGELVIWACLGTFVLAVGGVAHRRSSIEARAHSLDLAALLAALVFCAVVLDVVHILLQDVAYAVTAILEDGGELVVLSATVAYVIWIAQEVKARRPYPRILAASSSDRGAGRRASGSRARSGPPQRARSGRRRRHAS